MTQPGEVTIGALLAVAYYGIKVAEAGVHYSIKMAKPVRDLMAGLAEQAKDVAEAKRLLGVASEIGSQHKTPRRSDETAPPPAFYRSDNAHPLYRNRKSIHPDNFDAIQTLTKYEVSQAHAAGRLDLVDQVPASHEANLVLVGSPTGEGCSRLMFGYKEPADAVDVLQLADPPFDLPYSWVLDRESIEEGAVAARFVEGRKRLVKRPNWKVKSHRGNSSLYVPKVDPSERGLLADDYLLVTRVPNYLSAAALGNGRSVINFGGTHGIGTKAIDLLLRDRTALSELGRKLRGAQAYQALFQVGGIEHTSRGSRATKIELIDAEPLPVSQSVWDAARRAIEPAVTAWLGPASPARAENRGGQVTTRPV